LETAIIPSMFYSLVVPGLAYHKRKKLAAGRIENGELFLIKIRASFPERKITGWMR
jgi:hypothetical protein